MVMYTKKYPRLSEGYHDRHTYEKDSRYSNSRHNPIERRDYDKSPSHYSSPRYVHKSSHSDRNKDKHDRDHAVDSGSDRKLSGKSYKGSKHAEEDVPCHTLEANSSCRSDSSELKYDKRDGTDTGSDDQDHKDEVLKTAVRVCGLWSEHISSSGKRYYYNCETEVSQWEKPKEWTTDTPKSVDGRRQEEERKVEGKDDRQKLYVSNGGGAEKLNDSPRDTILVNGDKQEVSACQSTAILSRHNKKTETICGESVACLDAATVTPAKSKLSATPLAAMADRSNSVTELKHRPQPMEQASPAMSATPELRTSRDTQQGEDMEISPGNSPKRLQAAQGLHEVANTRNGHKKLPIPIASPCLSSPAIDTAQLIKQLGDKTLQTIDRNAMIGQALQTLQKLHEVIMSRQGLTATQQSPRSTCSESPFLPSKSPQTAHVWPVAPMTPLVVPDDVARPSTESPRSDSGSGNRALRKDAAAVSPALPVSSAGVPLPSSLAQAGSKLQPHAPQLLPAHLSNHFDEHLLMHVAGWPADHLEKQARRYTEEAHALGSLHCTKVSVDLKKARSLVRIAEIQSTLQEHRILFLQHRILELENANTHFATQ